MKNYERWLRAREPKEPFQGLMLEVDMPIFESCFEVNVEVFSLDENGVAKVVYNSLGLFPTTMYLNLSNKHLSYIHKFKQFCKKYQCKFCQKIWSSSTACKRHQSSCEKKNKFFYPGGFLSPPKYMFDLLSEAGINCKNEHYPWFISYDFEAIQPRVETGGDSKLQYQRKHIPVSVSVSSNVPEFHKPKCFVNLNPDHLIKDMLEYMIKIHEAAHKLANERWADELGAINFEIDSLKQKQQEDDTSPEELMEVLQGKKISFKTYTKEDEARKNELLSLLTRFEDYMFQIPVLGFCSSRYDINLVKEKLLLHLKLHEADSDCKSNFTIKKCNAYVCISNQHFRFLDMAQYLAPNSSYSSFLKAFDVEEEKGFFPYEWFDDYSKLDYPCLPGRQEFFNSFKNEELGQKDYDRCLRVWREEKMSTFKDYLIWYNNLDVGPFVTAVERWQQLYFDEDLDVFKTAVSLPGLARQILYRYARTNNAQFSLIDTKNADLHQLMSKCLFGGPSIIFHRHAESGVTKIRGGKVCQKVIGYDCNALYLWALDQTLPTGIFVRRKSETGFKPEVRDIYIKAFAWLNYLNEVLGVFIQHLRNVGCEKRIGPYPVDGYDKANKTVYQFHGCYFHGHLCDVTKNVKNPEWHANREARFNRTKETTEYIKNKGLKVVEMWECSFKKLCQSNPKLYGMMDEYRPDFHRKNKGPVTEKQILDGVRSGQLFGFVQCDLQVPQSWGRGFENFSQLPPLKYFEEMSPIFCTSEIPFEAFGEHMQNHVKEMGIGEQSRVLLVGGMSAQEILVATPLLRWYLEHGIEVTKIQQVVEYQQQRCFRGLSKNISEARREGDVNPDKKIMAETRKTQGNASYGCLCMDKTKHVSTVYYKGNVNVSQAVNESNFRKLTCLNEEEEFYEVEFAKDNIKLDVPIQIAVFILNLAKLRMLQFHYDFLDRLVDRSDYQLLEMDTDSSYMSLSKPSFEEVVKPHLKEDYLKALKGQCNDDRTPSLEYFPRSCCQKHALFDKREPGVFKTEFVGDEMIGLCSKTYFVENREQGISKMSCKGVNKNLVEKPGEVFRRVLKQKHPETSENRGIRAKGTTMYTYRQSKLGFNYFYVKRKVLEDGVTTVPLDIVLKPAKRLKHAELVDENSEMI
ncbi:MAG: hypothetical protein JAZ03_08205 [Candidatus Thiodiazotropha taylori]|nr:hypothetical protein [Candidatus Thiodiazotropha taylori]MCW4333907.1 hypothetical protein [Candidatus Thiodiazotropha endolucinida]